jgi:purine-binding chemotaxis protein CheW
MTAQVSVVRFKVCDNDYALAIQDVVEVAAMVETANLGEFAHPALRGVVIRRGQPLVLVDLRVLFGCPAAEITLDTLFVVVQPSGHRMAGFIVDAVQGVVYFSQDAIRPVRGENNYMRGVVAQGQGLVQWLDAVPILSDTLPEGE